MKFEELLLALLPALPFVIGVTEAAKVLFNATSERAKVAAGIIVGLVFGLGTLLTQTGAVLDPAYIVASVVASLALGLASTGLYAVGNKFAQRAGGQIV